MRPAYRQKSDISHITAAAMAVMIIITPIASPEL